MKDEFGKYYGEKIESLEVYEAQRRIAQATFKKKAGLKRRGGRKNGECHFAKEES